MFAAFMKILAVSLLPVLLATACSRGSAGMAFSSRSDDTLSADSSEDADITSEAELWADSVLSVMTLEQRVGQVFMPAIYASDDPSTLGLLRRYVSDCHVGGVVLLKGNLSSAAAIADTLSRFPETALFVAIDAEWGLNMRLKDAPAYPVNGMIGEEADEMLMFDYGREVARECRRVGITMLLGPVVDVVSGKGGAIGRRSFGSDPTRVADLAVAYACGVESGDVISVAKHFPGHGSPGGDSHRTLPVISGSRARLDSVDLYPFRRYIEAGLSAVMVGHLAVSAVDSLRRPAVMSPAVIGGLLRNEMAFRGLVLTDALNMAGASGYEVWNPIEAGADMVVAPADTKAAVEATLAAVRTGRLAVADIDRACRKILFYKYLVGLDSPESVNPHGLHADIDSEEARNMERRLEAVAGRQ